MLAFQCKKGAHVGLVCSCCSKRCCRCTCGADAHAEPMQAKVRLCCTGASEATSSAWHATCAGLVYKHSARNTHFAGVPAAAAACGAVQTPSQCWQGQAAPEGHEGLHHGMLHPPPCPPDLDYWQQLLLLVVECQWPRVCVMWRFDLGSVPVAPSAGADSGTAGGGWMGVRTNLVIPGLHKRSASLSSVRPGHGLGGSG